MATATAMRTAVETAVVANTSATAGAGAMVTDDISVTGTLVRIWADIVGKHIDSNQGLSIVNLRMQMLHKLPDPTDENTYQAGAKLTDQAWLTDLANYRALAEVHEVVSESAEVSLPERRGNVIDYIVTVQVTVTG